MRLTFRFPEVEPSSAPAPYDLVLGVVGTVRLLADDGGLVYEEVMVPIVELALALQDWLRLGVEKGIDFSYESVETGEPDQLWCRRTSAGWRVGSADETAPDPVAHPASAVVSAFSDFVQSVGTWLGSTTGRRLEEVRP